MTNGTAGHTNADFQCKVLQVMIMREKNIIHILHLVTYCIGGPYS